MGTDWPKDFADATASSQSRALPETRFSSLAEWSAGGNVSFHRKAAGVAVLTYLFHVCEVFES